MKHKKKILYFVLFFAVVGYAVFNLNKESKKFEADIKSAPKTKELISPKDDTSNTISKESAPFTLKFTNQEGLQVGNCVPITIEAFNENDLPMNKASYKFILYEKEIYPVTLFKIKDCSSDHNPSHIYQSINGAGKQTVYAIFTSLEIPKIEAYDFDENSLVIDKKGLHSLDPNNKQVKIIIDQSPKLIQEYQKFDISCHLTDVFENRLEKYKGKLTLYLGHGTTLDTTHPLAESEISDGYAYFRNVNIERTIDNQIIFFIALPDGTFTSTIIPKETFVPRNVKIQIEGGETLNGYFSSPDTVIVYGQRYYVTKDRNRLVVTIQNKKYYISNLDFNTIELRPY